MGASVIFRCDGSPLIGAGHLMRCFALAETMEGYGYVPRFISAPGSSTTLGVLQRSGYPINAPGEGSEAIDNSSIAVIDGYQFTEHDEQALVGKVRTLVAFDDLPDRRHQATVLVDPTPGRKAAAYGDLVRPSGKILTGSRYAIVRPLWRRARQMGRRVSEPRVVVSMGATDPTNATASVVEAIKASRLDAPVDVILGAAAPHRADIESRLDARTTLHVDPTDMPRLLSRATLAIGSPGSSSFERAVLGVPSIVVQTADNQVDVAAAFAEAGAARVVPSAVLENPSVFGATIADVAQDPVALASMSVNASGLCDGRGALRLLAALTGTVTAKDGVHLHIRLAEQDDADWLLDMQRKPETRRFARNPDPPSAQEHTNWFTHVLDDPDRTLLIVESERRSLGYVRLDRLGPASPVFEISVGIDPAFHGRGYGGAALALLRMFAPGATFDATVLSGNMASHGLFARAGYKRISPDLFRSLPN